MYRIPKTSALDLKPDIFLKDLDGFQFIDLASSDDIGIDVVQIDKVEQFQCIEEFLNQQEIQCALNAIVFRSLGAVHRQELKLVIIQKVNKNIDKAPLK